MADISMAPWMMQNVYWPIQLLEFGHKVSYVEIKGFAISNAMDLPYRSLLASGRYQEWILNFMVKRVRKKILRTLSVIL